MNKEELIKQMQELEKALEAKKAELERLEKQDRLKKYADVKAGETFIYKKHEYTKLKNGRAIIDDYDSDFMDCLFDNVNNDYDESIIRHYINTNKFLQFLGLCYCDFANNDAVDCCKLLSKEEYEKNKDIIKKFDNWWWLRSGHYYNSNYAYYVNSYGDVNNCSVDYSGSNVRPSFNFHDDIEVEVVE